MVGALPIATVQAPILKSAEGESVVKFRVDYERYLRQVEHINSSIKDKSKQIEPVGYKSCITGELLLSLVELDIFDGISEVKNIQDSHVKTWLESRGRCTTADTPTQVKDALSKVKFRTDSRYPEGSVLAFFIDVVTELRRNRA